MSAPKPDPVFPIIASLTDLGTHLALWALRDATLTQPQFDHSGMAAVNAIDAALRHLYSLRGRLVTEVREHQDAVAARIDALIARNRDSR